MNGPNELQMSEVASRPRAQARILDKRCHAVKLSGGFEQIPNCIKGSSLPGCTPDFFRFLAVEPGSRRYIVAHRQCIGHYVRPPDPLRNSRLV
jgi:hypothetical protein